MIISKEIVFFYKALIFAVMALIIIPKPLYKKYFGYGFIYGGLGSIITILILDSLNLVKYQNMKVFNILDKFAFWTPLAWTFVLMFYFYLMPAKKVYLYPYILGFAFLGFMIGLVLANFGLYWIKPVFMYILPFSLLVYFTLGAWLYLKSERITLR